MYLLKNSRKNFYVNNFNNSWNIQKSSHIDYLNNSLIHDATTWKPSQSIKCRQFQNFYFAFRALTWWCTSTDLAYRFCYCSLKKFVRETKRNETKNRLNRRKDQGQKLPRKLTQMSSPYEPTCSGNFSGKIFSIADENSCCCLLLLLGESFFLVMRFALMVKLQREILTCRQQKRFCAFDNSSA